MKYNHYLILITFILLIGCASSDGDDDSNKQTTNAPISIAIENQELTAGEPVGFVYTVPVTTGPYTEVSIDLAKTLESANIEVTPR